MSVPTQRLQTPEIPGYVLYWFRDEPGRIERALQAGYTFVTKDELDLNRAPLGSPAGHGSSDLGSHVSLASGGMYDSGTAQRLYLMKLPEDLHKQDMETRDSMGQQVVDSVYHGLAEGDSARQYRKHGTFGLPRKS